MVLTLFFFFFFYFVEMGSQAKKFLKWQMRIADRLDDARKLLILPADTTLPPRDEKSSTPKATSQVVQVDEYPPEVQLVWQRSHSLSSNGAKAFQGESDKMTYFDDFSFLALILFI